MEFWGVEVKAGKPLLVQPELGKLIHISQASLGEVKKDAKGTKNVPLRLKIDGKDLIIGNLAPEDRPQLIFDLVFEREFELSHDLKSGSVYFIGYTADEPMSDAEGFSSDEDDESEEELAGIKDDGEAKAKAVEKPVAAPNGAAKAAKAGPIKVVAKKEELSDSDDEDDSDEEMPLVESLGGDSSDDLSEQDSEDDDDDDDSEEELVVEPLKKRPAQAEAAPVPAKKAKASAPIDNKKGNKGQNVSPNPSKPAGKASPGGNKSKQSPKSGGQFSGGNKNFNSKNGGKGKRGGK